MIELQDIYPYHKANTAMLVPRLNEKKINRDRETIRDNKRQRGKRK